LPQETLSSTTAQSFVITSRNLGLTSQWTFIELIAFTKFGHGILVDCHVEAFLRLLPALPKVYFGGAIFFNDYSPRYPSSIWKAPFFFKDDW